MIDFSISSVNMAILVSNLFIIFLVLIFRNRKIMFRLGLPLLVGFVILICVRMIFPVELLPISHNVYLPDLLTTIVGETRRVRFFMIRHPGGIFWKSYGDVVSYIRCSNTSNAIMLFENM